MGKGGPCYTGPKKLAELYSCFSVLQKEELASDEIGYLAEAISKLALKLQDTMEVLEACADSLP